jgi:hypothetical protein
MMRCRTSSILTAVFAAAAVSLLAAGCGGGSSTTAATTPTQSGALSYARCMRAHGVQNFPDPTGGNNKQAVVSALQAVGTSQAQAAQTACVHVNGGSPGAGQSPAHSQARTAGMIAFARCIRGHGFPNFPDPTSSGQLTHQMVADAGINLHQPAVLEAGDACVTVSHGFITKDDVARFVAGD